VGQNQKNILEIFQKFKDAKEIVRGSGRNNLMCIVAIGYIYDVFYDVHRKNDSIELLEFKQDTYVCMNLMCVKLLVLNASHLVD